MITVTDSTVLKSDITALDFKVTAVQGSLMFYFRPQWCEKNQAIGLQ